MKSTLLIKDLAFDQQLGGKAMAAVHGGHGYGDVTSQSNATYQANNQSLFAPVAVGNGSAFMGKGPVTFNVVSNPSQYASNDSTSTNTNWDGFGFPFLRA